VREAHVLSMFSIIAHPTPVWEVIFRQNIQKFNFF